MFDNLGIKTKGMIKKIFSIIFIFIFMNSCAGIKENLTLNKKKNVDEFLIEKKDPLTKPPNFNELPEPLEKKISENIDEGIDLTEIIGDSNKNVDTNEQSNIEKSILDILSKK